MTMINVQLSADGPITQMDESRLVRTEGNHEDDNERTKWIEYRLKSDPTADRAVHRSVHIILKKPGVSAEAIAGMFPS